MELRLLKIHNGETFDYITICNCHKIEDVLEKIKNNEYLVAITNENEDSRVIYINPKYIEFIFERYVNDE